MADNQIQISIGAVLDPSLESSTKEASDLLDSQFAKSQQSQVDATTSALDAQNQAYALSAAARAGSEADLTAQVQKAIDDRLEFEMEGMDVDSASYAALESEKEKIDQAFANSHSENMSKMAQEDAKSWMSMLAPFNNVLNQMLSGHANWARIEENLMRQLIMKMVEEAEQEVVAWIAGEAAKTAATNAGNTARTASTAAGASASAAAEGSAMKTSAMGHAYSAAAAVYDDVAQIPYIGWILAPAAAGAALAAVLALGGNIPSFASGAWELPHDTLAQVHKGEMVLPAGPAAALRSGFALPGQTTNNALATTHQWNYAPTINGVPEHNVMDELRNNSAEFLSFVRGLTRGGSVRFA